MPVSLLSKFMNVYFCCSIYLLHGTDLGIYEFNSQLFVILHIDLFCVYISLPV